MMHTQSHRQNTMKILPICKHTPRQLHRAKDITWRRRQAQIKNGVHRGTHELTLNAGDDRPADEKADTRENADAMSAN